MLSPVRLLKQGVQVLTARETCHLRQGGEAGSDSQQRFLLLVIPPPSF